MIIREVLYQDLLELLNLYTHLHDREMPVIDNSLQELWNGILNDPNHHILVAFEDGVLVSSCVLIVVPNLTHKQKSYALIENVITHPQYRKKGYATQVLDYAKRLALENNCYKIMLMTGSKEASVFRFYEGAGYNSEDKTAFIQWLD